LGTGDRHPDRPHRLRRGGIGGEVVVRHGLDSSEGQDMAEPQERTPEGGRAMERILAWAQPTDGAVLDERAQALDGGAIEGDADGEQLDRADRAALRRVDGLRTELEDVTEVEYRELR